MRFLHTEPFKVMCIVAAGVIFAATVFKVWFF